MGDRCSGKEEEKARTLKTFRGSAGGRHIAVGGGIGAVVLIVLYLLLGGDPQAPFDSQQPSTHRRASSPSIDESTFQRFTAPDGLR